MIGGTVAAQYPDRIGAAVLMNATASPAGWRHRIEFPLLAQLGRMLGGIRGPLTERVIDAFVGPTTRRARPQVVQKSREALTRGAERSPYWDVHSIVHPHTEHLSLVVKIRPHVPGVASAAGPVFPLAASSATQD